MALFGPVLAGLLPAIIDRGSRFLGGALGGLAAGRTPIQAIENGILSAVGESGRISMPVQSPKSEANVVASLPEGVIPSKQYLNQELFNRSMSGRGGDLIAGNIPDYHEYRNRAMDGPSALGSRPRMYYAEDRMMRHKPKISAPQEVIEDIIVKSRGKKFVIPKKIKGRR